MKKIRNTVAWFISIAGLIFGLAMIDSMTFNYFIKEDLINLFYSEPILGIILILGILLSLLLLVLFTIELKVENTKEADSERLVEVTEDTKTLKSVQAVEPHGYKIYSDGDQHFRIYKNWSVYNLKTNRYIGSYDNNLIKTFTYCKDGKKIRKNVAKLVAELFGED